MTDSMELAQLGAHISSRVSLHSSAVTENQAISLLEAIVANLEKSKILVKNRIASDAEVDALLVAVSGANDGDLDTPIDRQSDDVAGQIGRALDKLFSELHSSMSWINQNATHLAQATPKMSKLSNDMNEVVSSNSNSTQHASALSGDVSASIEIVADAANRMTTLISSVADKALINQRASDEVSNVSIELSDMAMQM